MRENVISQLFSNSHLHLHWLGVLEYSGLLWLSTFWDVAFWYIFLILQLCFSLEGHSLLSNMRMDFHHYLPILTVNNNLKIISMILYDLFTFISESTELHFKFSNVCTGWRQFWVVGSQFDSLMSQSTMLA